jgi:hypothetical protein
MSQQASEKPPLMTLQDVADLTGSTYQQWLRVVKTNPDHPKPINPGARTSWRFRRAEIERFLRGEQ